VKRCGARVLTLDQLEGLKVRGKTCLWHPAALSEMGYDRHGPGSNGRDKLLGLVVAKLGLATTMAAVIRCGCQLAPTPPLGEQSSLLRC
jgi:hypothetical protein